MGAGGASQTSAANPGAPARWYGLSPDEGAAVVPPLMVGVLMLIPLEQSTLGSYCGEAVGPGGVHGCG